VKFKIVNKEQEAMIKSLLEWLTSTKSWIGNPEAFEIALLSWLFSRSKNIDLDQYTEKLWTLKCFQS
jgi:hypothetical protein